MTTMKKLTVNEAAKRLGKRPETVRRWISAGRLKAECKERLDGRHVVIPEKALAAFSDRICENCGKTYTPARPTRGGRYCSKPCAWEAAYKRQKAEAATKPAPKAAPRPNPAKNVRLEAALRYAKTALTPK